MSCNLYHRVAVRSFRGGNGIGALRGQLWLRLEEADNDEFACRFLCIRCRAEWVWRAAWAWSAAKPCARYIRPRGFVRTITRADRSDLRPPDGDGGEEELGNLFLSFLVILQ